MIVSHPIYGDEINLRCSIQDKVTSAWQEVLAESTQVSITRGGDAGDAGTTTTDVGTMSLNILDVYSPSDPTYATLLSPGANIVLYINEGAVPMTTGAIFTGTIQDISTNYFYENGKQHMNVTLLAVDAVSSHSGITVDGFTGTNITLPTGVQRAFGFQRWEDRINDLSTAYAKTTVPTVIISAPVPVYNI